jgi:hypothetical protein
MDSIIIPDLHDLAIEAFQSDEKADEFSEASEANFRIFQKLFNLLESGEINAFYYDSRSENGTYNRYIFHKSAKKPGYIQKSCIWYGKNEKDVGIPLSDINRKNALEFHKCCELPSGIEIFYGKF